MRRARDVGGFSAERWSLGERFTKRTFPSSMMFAKSIDGVSQVRNQRRVLDVSSRKRRFLAESTSALQSLARSSCNSFHSFLMSMLSSSLFREFQSSLALNSVSERAAKHDN